MALVGENNARPSAARARPSRRSWPQSSPQAIFRSLPRRSRDHVLVHESEIEIHSHRRKRTPKALSYVRTTPGDPPHALAQAAEHGHNHRLKLYFAPCPGVATAMFSHTRAKSRCALAGGSNSQSFCHSRDHGRAVTRTGAEFSKATGWLLRPTSGC